MSQPGKIGVWMALGLGVVLGGLAVPAAAQVSEKPPPKKTMGQWVWEQTGGDPSQLKAKGGSENGAPAQKVRRTLRRSDPRKMLSLRPDQAPDHGESAFTLLTSDMLDKPAWIREAEWIKAVFEQEAFKSLGRPGWMDEAAWVHRSLTWAGVTRSSSASEKTWGAWAAQLGLSLVQSPVSAKEGDVVRSAAFWAQKGLAASGVGEDPVPADAFDFAVSAARQTADSSSSPEKPSAQTTADERERAQRLREEALKSAHVLSDEELMTLEEASVSPAASADYSDSGPGLMTGQAGRQASERALRQSFSSNGTALRSVRGLTQQGRVAAQQAVPSSLPQSVLGQIPLFSPQR